MALSRFTSDRLTERRDALNAALARVARAHGMPDKDALRGFVEQQLDPLAQSLEALDADRAKTAFLPLFDLGAGLCAQRLAGPAAREPRLNDTWNEVLPPFGALILAQPERMAGLILNASSSLGKWPHLNHALWRARLVAVAWFITSESDLRASLIIAAWQSGLSIVRAEALDAADGLSPKQAAALVGLPDAINAADALSKMRKDRWWSPDGPMTMMLSAGAFTGFGGVLPAPPRLQAMDDGFRVESGGHIFHLCADRFGAIFRNASQDAPKTSKNRPPQSVRVEGPKLIIGKTRIDHGLPPETTDLICNADTVALTSPYTHSIRLFPLATT